MQNNNLKKKISPCGRLNYHQTIIILLALAYYTECNDDSSPTSLLTTTQTHIIPKGSYFQYTFTSMNLEEAQYNTSISDFAINLNLALTNTAKQNLLYNILVFPQVDPSSQPLYESFVRAVVEGLPGLSPVFPTNYSEPQTSCQQCYQDAMYSFTPIACLNCTDSQLSINLTSEKWVQLQSWNNTVMTVIDNSIIMINSTERPEINLNLGYQVNILYDEEYKALFILFFSVVSALIIILIVLAIFLTLRIKKIENQIKQCKEKTKIQ